MEYTGLFFDLDSEDLSLVNGGKFWTGVELVGMAIVVGTAAVVAAPVAGASVGLGLLIGGSFLAAQFGFAVGIAEMCGADL